MTPKKAALAALLIAATVLSFYLGKPKVPPVEPAPGEPTTPPPGTIPQQGPDRSVVPPSVAPKPSSQTPPPAPVPTPAATPTRTITMLPVAETTALLHDPKEDPQEDLHIIEGLLENYRRVYKENPVAGLNEEVVDALIGNNEKGIGLIPADHPAINHKGQLVDRWGTPYVFHALSGQHMQLLSAGPDKKIGTEDDFTIE